MNKDIDKALEFTKTVTPKILFVDIVVLLASEDIMTVPWIILTAAVISSMIFTPIIDVTYCNNYTLIIITALILLIYSQIATILIDMTSEYKILLNRTFMLGGLFITLLNLVLGGMATVKIMKLKKKNTEDKGKG